MKNRAWQFFAIVMCVAATSAKSQSVKQIFSNSGIWQGFDKTVSAVKYPEFRGRLANINWSDIEIAPNTWDWSTFDKDITDHIADSLPVIFMVYTRQNAPDWIYSNGVPKVTETNASGTVTGYSPYYLDPDYNFYFKRMITKVRQHVQTLQPSIRNMIIGVQACFGSTGDQIAYKGLVAPQYAISDAQFDSLFKVYSLYYYNEYKDLVPKITMLSNPNYQDPAEQYWLRDNCPGGWTKCGTMGKGFQLNMESDKLTWLYDLLNKPQAGQYLRSRSEISGVQLNAGWWSKNPYKSMFALVNYCIFWGMDWPNMTGPILMDHRFDSSMSYFNKYAGQKVAAVATNAVCALKDALDASDSVRFPVAAFGTYDKLNTTRYRNIYKQYAPYGAKLEDPSVVTLSEYDVLDASGTNDVGWHLLPGNWERYLHQIDANVTSAGYWNIDAAHSDVMYGRFARGFDIANNKNGLYFDVDDAFLRSAPLNAAYPVTIAITYYDSGVGSWRLYYDAVTAANKSSQSFTCTNTMTWKKAVVKLTDAYFGNRGLRGADFYIKNTGTQNVIFSVVELSRPAQPDTGFLLSPLPAFDTVCLQSVVPPQSFVINGNYLDGTGVTAGPLNGFLFSDADSGTYSKTLTFSGYGKQLNATVYVKLVTNTEGRFDGNIPVSGGGYPTSYVPVKGTVMNTSPALNPKVTTVSCYNKKDGSIDLQPTGGLGPFSYYWTSDARPAWDTTSQDLSGLSPANYTVVLSSYAGCSISKTFSITQPAVLSMSVVADSAILCKGGTTTVKVTATGGTTPYTGTGTFTVSYGTTTYPVNDYRGCSTSKSLWIANGSIASPSTPSGIIGPTSVTGNQSGIVYSVKNPNSSYTYIWTVPSDATITTGQNTASIKVTWGTSSGKVSVKASNQCGTSAAASISVAVTSAFTAQVSSAASSDNSSNRRFLVMPNPAKDMATVQFYADRSFVYSLDITDVSGRKLYSKKATAYPGNNLQQLNVQGFANGQYFITISNDKGEKQTLRLLKE